MGVPLRSPPVLARISDYVGWHAERTPDAEAMILNDARINYARFHAEVESLAKALIAAGVSKGDRIAALSPPAPDYFITFLAAASIGAVWVGLNPRYTLNELSYVIDDCDPSIIFARLTIGERTYADELTALAGKKRRIVLLDGRDDDQTGRSDYTRFLDAGAEIGEDRLANARSSCGGRDPCMIVYTSGSTGRPKGALLHHHGVVSFSLAQNRIWPVSPLRTLNYFPINHIGCVVDLSSPTLVSGGAIVFMEQFDPGASLRLMEKERVTFWGSVPSVFQLQLADKEINRIDLSAVQIIVWEGAAMPGEMIERLAAYDRPMASNYGMTESCGAITVIPPTRDRDILERTVGWPFEGVDVRIRDATGNLAGAGETGEIETLSPFSMLGYWNRPDASDLAFTDDGWLRTGDLGRINPDDSISIAGRATEMYKSGGYNVYPREVENVLDEHANVDFSAVVSVADPLWQEVGVAYVILRAPVSANDLMKHCRDNLANYKIPKKIVILDAMPLLPIGKVDKVALKARAAQEYAADDPTTRENAEQALARNEFAIGAERRS
ncbi:MAG: AMP-binding protein [Parvularculaceae bacterium]|nr:AMP-binding protein [Parvularculaceae bacterium]